MPRLESAKKRVKQEARNRARNRARKSMVKGDTRAFLDAVHDGKVDDAKKAFVTATKRLDQTAAKGTLHKNTVARRKSKMAKKLNALMAGKK